jgi:L-ribulose-5-phosphate 3-epimerase
VSSYRLGYNTNGFAHHRLEDALRIIAEAGYEAVAITPDVHHLPPYEIGAAELQKTRRLLHELGLVAVVETGARYVLDPRRKHRPNLLDPDPAAREIRVRFLGRCAEIASELGANTISIWSGGRPAETAPEEADRYLRDGVARVCRRAEVLGVQVAFEPEPGMHVETLAQWDALRSDLDASNLGLTLDVGHVPCTETITPGAAIRERAHELLNVHLDDCGGRVHEHLQIGEGELDWGEIGEALRGAGYSGLASFELSRHSHAAPEAATTAIRRFARYR